MNRSAGPLQIGVLGAGRIGQVHARILHSLGAQVCAVLGSSQDSSAQAARAVAEICGHEVRSCGSLDELLGEDLNGISICSPAEYHFEQILTAFDRRVPVFCEKPLFWDDSCTSSVVAKRLGELEAHPERRLFVNTSNTVFLDVAEASLPSFDSVKDFGFAFHTNGAFRGTDIAMDLLPHGLSLLLHAFGQQTLSDLRWQASENEYQCEFQYGDCAARFEFRESPDIERSLSFRFDECEFRRIQEGSGAGYRVFLENPQSGERLDAPDPFEVYLSEFLEFCRTQPSNRADRFESAAANMKLMAQCMDACRLYSDA